MEKKLIPLASIVCLRYYFSEAYFKGLSVEAKVLYGLVLDRMSLSMKNQWIDAEGKVYINFSVENIQEYMGCSKNKAVAILKVLDSDGGIGLVEKKRQENLQ